MTRIATRRSRRPLGMEPRRGSVQVWVLGLVLVGLVGFGGWLTSDYLVSDEVRVPSVVGLDYDAAAASLRVVGLTPRLFAELDARARPNEVLSQAPPAGQAVRPGRIVALGVNTVPEVRVAPDVQGLREPDAVARAGALGVVVERVIYVHAERPAGTVVRQDPAAGAALAPSQGLVVSVSRGAVDVPFVLPDLRGQPIEAAAAMLEALGVRQVERVAAAVSFDRAGAVTDQLPAPGVEVLAATPVTLVYAVEGTRVVPVPDLVGLPLWRAQLSLRAARLELGAVRRIDDPNLPEGVVEAVPAGYTVVGSPIGVIVNGGGGQLDIDDGDRLLWPGDLGLPGDGRALPPVGGPGSGAVVIPPLADPDPVVEEPLVPAPGTARRAEDGSRVIPFRFDPAAVGIASLARDSYQLRLVVTDEDGERVEFDRLLAAGEGVEVPVRVAGDDAMLQTFINGLFFQAWRP